MQTHSQEPSEKSQSDSHDAGDQESASATPILRQSMDFAVAYLNSNPTATAQALRHELDTLHLNSSILPLRYRASKGFVIAISDHAAGTCFVVARSAGKPFASIWQMTAETLSGLPHGGSWMASVEEGRPESIQDWTAFRQRRMGTRVSIRAATIPGPMAVLSQSNSSCGNGMGDRPNP